MDWAEAFSNIGSKLLSGNNLANFGNVLGGAGQLYSAYNSKNLQDQQVDLMKQQNKLYMDDYEQKKRDRDSLNNSFSSVWGS